MGGSDLDPREWTGPLNPVSIADQEARARAEAKKRMKKIEQQFQTEEEGLEPERYPGVPLLADYAKMRARATGAPGRRTLIRGEGEGERVSPRGIGRLRAPLVGATGSVTYAADTTTDEVTPHVPRRTGPKWDKRRQTVLGRNRGTGVSKATRFRR
jgi:hypothetical protein